ncbi:MAG: hypothetical protein R2794_04720 [Chitinophagales bacterium]
MRLYIRINNLQRPGYYTREDLLNKIKKEKLLFYSSTENKWSGGEGFNYDIGLKEENLLFENYAFKFSSIPREMSLGSAINNKMQFYLLSLAAILLIIAQSIFYSPFLSVGYFLLSFITAVYLGERVDEANRNGLFYGFLTFIFPFIIPFIVPSTRRKNLALTRVVVDLKTDEELIREREIFDRSNRAIKRAALVLVVIGLVSMAIILFVIK